MCVYRCLQVYMCVFVCTCVCVYVCVLTSVRACVCMYVRACVRARACVCVRARTRVTRHSSFPIALVFISIVTLKPQLDFTRMLKFFRQLLKYSGGFHIAK